MSEFARNFEIAWGRHEPWATLGLAGVLLLSAAGQLAAGGLHPKPSPGVLYALGAPTGSAVTSAEWFRLPLGALLHSSPLHFITNLPLVIAAGQIAERRLGVAPLVLIAGVSGIAGFLAIQGRIDTMAVGSSGVGSGLIGAVAIMTWRLRRRLTSAHRALLFGLVVGVFAIEQFLALLHPNLAVGSHLAGFATGAMVAWSLERVADGPDGRVPAWTRWLAAFVAGLYLIAPLAAWHHLESGRACSSLDSGGWSEEAMLELKRGLQSQGHPCER